MENTVASAEELTERLFGSLLGTLDVFAIYLGDRLGFYEILANGTPLTAPELAECADTNRRYTREWLEQQGATGIIRCLNPDAEAGERRFELPGEYRELFIDPESMSAIAPMAQVCAGVVAPIVKLVDAYKSGEGVAYEAFGSDMAEGQARANRPIFRHQLVQEWIAGMPDVEQRLRSDPPATVADIGMGFGWSSIYLAEAFPKIHVDGFNLDRNSVEHATRNATERKVDDRVHFSCKNAGDPGTTGTYDFAMAIECIHDMSDPISALSSMRRLVGTGGTVMIADERVPEEYAAPGDDLLRFFYGASVLHCLPVGMVDEHSAATGTVIRESTMHDYVERAGFAGIEALPIEHMFFRIYRLTA